MLLGLKHLRLSPAEIERDTLSIASRYCNFTDALLAHYSYENTGEFNL
jgi:hypothetical protein